MPRSKRSKLKQHQNKIGKHQELKNSNTIDILIQEFEHNHDSASYTMLRLLSMSITAQSDRASITCIRNPSCISIAVSNDLKQ